MIGCRGREVLLEYGGCEVVNPGSLVEGKFVVYRVGAREMEFSECS